MFLGSLITLFAAIPSAKKALPPYINQGQLRAPISISSVKQILIESPSSKIFFLNCVVLGSAMSLVESLLFVAMERTMKGYTPIIAGTSVLISVLFEIPIFQIAPRLIKTYGPKYMITLANFAWVIRALGYALFDQAWMVLVLELFHGVSFGLFYSAAVHICVQQCPPGMESTMQSLLDMTYGGFGVTLGSICGGFLFDWIGSSATFVLFAGIVTCTTVLFFFMFQDKKEHEIQNDLELKPVVETREDGASVIGGRENE